MFHRVPSSLSVLFYSVNRLKLIVELRNEVGKTKWKWKSEKLDSFHHPLQVLDPPVQGSSQKSIGITEVLCLRLIGNENSGWQ